LPLDDDVLYPGGYGTKPTGHVEYGVPERGGASYGEDA
jgi:hypothetical protein